jgi:hypothetical protein
VKWRTSHTSYPVPCPALPFPSPALQLAKEAGDFLLVGLHTDEDVESRRGPHTPIMNVHERALSVLACKYVDEVRDDGAVAVREGRSKGRTAAGLCAVWTVVVRGFMQPWRWASLHTRAGTFCRGCPAVSGC